MNGFNWYCCVKQEFFIKHKGKYPGLLLVQFALVTLGLYVLFLFGPAFVQAADNLQREQIEAGLVYKFISFIDWPEQSSGEKKESALKADKKVNQPFVIGVLGNDRLIKAFAPVIGRSVKEGRRLVVEKISSDDPLPVFARCQILYLAPTTKSEILVLLARVKNLQVLTVSDMEGFVDLGGVIGFSEQQGRMKFSINNRVARARGIYINAKLMRVAVRVVGIENDK